METENSIRDISDTALWVAIYRARESERDDAIFRDPFARRLAGERGEQIAGEMQTGMRYEWPYVSRTYGFDKIVADCVGEGTDAVINLAAGLDTRPYRMDLPASLRWIEVDLPNMIEYKQSVLDGETPRCHLERVKLDLTDTEARRELFARVGSESDRVLVLSEGLIVYFSRDEVIELAGDLHAQANFTDWAIDLCTPALLKMLQKNLAALEKAGSPLRFGPEEGPDFFTPLGWRPAEISSSLHTAAKLRRLPFLFRLMSMLPDSQGRKPNAVWGGVIRLTRI